MSRVARYINRRLPMYIPWSGCRTIRRYRWCLAIWNCGRRKSLVGTIKDIRITVRKDGFPVFVLKRGHV